MTSRAQRPTVAYGLRVLHRLFGLHYFKAWGVLLHRMRHPLLLKRQRRRGCEKCHTTPAGTFTYTGRKHDLVHKPAPKFKDAPRLLASVLLFPSEREKRTWDATALFPQTILELLCARLGLPQKPNCPFGRRRSPLLPILQRSQGHAEPGRELRLGESGGFANSLDLIAGHVHS